MSAKPRWESHLTWDNNRTTYNGITYQLETHSYWTGKGGWSGTDDYHVHEIGYQQPMALYGPLGTNRRRALRLAELHILGWSPAQAMDRDPATGQDRWKAPDGTLHALADVLIGTVPHAPGPAWTAQYHEDEPTQHRTETEAIAWCDEQTRANHPGRVWDWVTENGTLQMVWTDPDTDATTGRGPGRVTPPTAP